MWALDAEGNQDFISSVLYGQKKKMQTPKQTCLCPGCQVLIKESSAWERFCKRKRGGEEVGESNAPDVPLTNTKL